MSLPKKDIGYGGRVRTRDLCVVSSVWKIITPIVHRFGRLRAHSRSKPIALSMTYGSPTNKKDHGATNRFQTQRLASMASNILYIRFALSDASK